MGAYAPMPGIDQPLEQAIGQRIVAPVLAELARRGTPFRGTLYCGLMVTPAGPRVVEFNARLGDPEAQVVLPLLEGSLTRLLAGAARGSLDPDAVTRGTGCAVAVALADEGYPEAVRGGGVIAGLDEAGREPGVLVFHAASVPEPDGRWRVSGGRAAYLVGRDATLAAARERAYGALGRLGGGGWRCRMDVGALGTPAAAGRAR
jgi:phosphoribosylamine--glycine ligase